MVFAWLAQAELSCPGHSTCAQVDALVPPSLSSPHFYLTTPYFFDSDFFLQFRNTFICLLVYCLSLLWHVSSTEQGFVFVLSCVPGLERGQAFVEGIEGKDIFLQG